MTAQDLVVEYLEFKKDKTASFIAVGLLFLEFKVDPDEIKDAVFNLYTQGRIELFDLEDVHTAKIRLIPKLRLVTC